MYHFSCPHKGFPLRPGNYYVGYTQTTLSRRLIMYLGNGAIKDHFQQTHMTLTRNNIVVVDCTEITKGESDVIRLQIAEAVIIL